MRAALIAHDEVLRTAIEAHDGFLFSHTGDGVDAPFASPMSAVNAAIDAQRELELPVRMGSATGEAELRDGDYFGTVLNRAARVMAAGHGGQILVADSTAVLLSGVDLVDLGRGGCETCRTRSRCFKLQGAGLRSGLSAVATSTRVRGTCGRRPRVSSGASPNSPRSGGGAGTSMVTLTGVGGVGKTRLALAVAARLANEFPDGVRVFELAAVNDPAAVSDAVAAVLFIAQQPGKSLAGIASVRRWPR